MQNRALKVSGTRESVKKTYYFRDAQGNVLATYTLKNDVLTLEEIDIYGSSRLGLLKPNLQMYPSVSVENKDFEGKKNYELANHLGNVLAVISDRKKGMGSTVGNYAYFDAVTVSATDYYPFGMAMPSRTYNTEGYRYGFNGKENDAEWAKQDYGARISDPRIGRFLSFDPLFKSYPWNSPYAFAENDVIRAIDLDGAEKYIVSEQELNRNTVVRGNRTVTTASYLIKIAELRSNGQLVEMNMQYLKNNSKATTKDILSYSVDAQGTISNVKFSNTFTTEQKEVLAHGQQSTKQSTGDESLSLPPTNTTYQSQDKFDTNTSLVTTQCIVNTITNITMVPNVRTTTVPLAYNSQTANFTNPTAATASLNSAITTLKRNKQASITIQPTSNLRPNPASPNLVGTAPASGFGNLTGLLTARANTIRQTLIANGVRASQITIGSITDANCLTGTAGANLQINTPRPRVDNRTSSNCQ